VGDRECRAREIGVKAMEAVKILDGSREGLPGVWGVERSEGDDGNWGGPPRPDGLRVGAVGAVRLITGLRREVGCEPGGRRRRS
jgi:hypothetical protein